MERGFIRSQKKLGYCLNFTRSLYGNHGWVIGLSDHFVPNFQSNVAKLGKLKCFLFF